MKTREKIFDRLTRKIDKSESAKMPVIVGINGVDCSGKTIFANAFADHLAGKNRKSSVIHLDDFHQPVAVRSRGDTPVDAYYQNAFNLPRLVDELLAPIQKHGWIDKSITLLNLDTDEYSVKKHFRIDPDDIVILEGVLLYREPINRYFGMRVFLDISFDDMLRRAYERDVPRFGADIMEKYKHKYQPIQQHYMNLCQPKGQSDFVIDNKDPKKPVIIDCE